MKDYPDVKYLRGLARDVGSIMLEYFGRKRVTVKIKPDKTPVTNVDKACHKLVVSRLKKDFPRLKVIGEEGNNAVKSSEYVVVFDALDGTGDFIAGVPDFTFVISVLRNWEPLISLIHDPVGKRTWHATRGQGAFLGYHRLALEPEFCLIKRQICLCWWAEADFNLTAVSNKMYSRRASWTKSGAIALYGGLVASGGFHATVFPGRDPWETIAMQLIVEEAGGKATDIHGKPLVYGPDRKIDGHIISCGGGIHYELVELTASCQSKSST